MKVKMVRFGGIDKRHTYRAGEVYDVPDELAQEMLADGRAIPVRDKRTVETVVAKPQETTRKR